MGIPNAAQARVDHEKITEYLLCPTHPDAASKAAFFRAFGFRLEHWEALAQALLRHGAACPVVRVVESAFGTRYIVEGPLETPSERQPVVRTVWIVEKGSSGPRLVTAFPA